MIRTQLRGRGRGPTLFFTTLDFWLPARPVNNVAFLDFAAMRRISKRDGGIKPSRARPAVRGFSGLPKHGLRFFLEFLVE